MKTNKKLSTVNFKKLQEKQLNQLIGGNVTATSDTSIIDFVNAAVVSSVGVKSSGSGAAAASYAATGRTA